MHLPRFSLLALIAAAGFLSIPPAEAGCMPAARQTQAASDSTTKIDVGGIEISTAANYHKSKDDPNYYYIRITTDITTSAKRPVVAEWEHTIRGAGPAEFSIRKKGAAAPIKEEPYPCGGNCKKDSQKLTRKKPTKLYYNSAAHRIDDLDAEYEVKLDGKVKVGGQWRDYSCNRTIIPRQYLRPAK